MLLGNNWKTVVQLCESRGLCAFILPFLEEKKRNKLLLQASKQNNYLASQTYNTFGHT